jgi:hypothetical protein
MSESRKVALRESAIEIDVKSTVQQIDVSTDFAKIRCPTRMQI